MAVKRSQSAQRVLAALEHVAHHQPVGVTALAKLMEEDKSAVQRALMTLADSGWIRPAPGAAGQWELTPHILTVAHPPHSSNDLRRRVRGALEALRSQTDETVYLIVPDGRHFVVIDALESRQMLRMASPIGMITPARVSATGRAVLAYLSPDEQSAWLGEAPSKAQLEEFAATRARGYAISDGDIVPGSVTLAAPIFEYDGRPIGAVVVSSPSERMTEARRHDVGPLVAQTARELSRGKPARAGL